MGSAAASWSVASIIEIAFERFNGRALETKDLGTVRFVTDGLGLERARQRVWVVLQHDRRKLHASIRIERNDGTFLQMRRDARHGWVSLLLPCCALRPAVARVRV